VLFEHNSINKRANAGRAFMQRHRLQPVHGTLFSALEQEHNVVLSSSTSPMMRGEDLMVWEPALQIAPRARGGGPQGDQYRRVQAARRSRIDHKQPFGCLGID